MVEMSEYGDILEENARRRLEDERRFGLPRKSRWERFKEDFWFWWDEKTFNIKFWLEIHSWLVPFFAGFFGGILGSLICRAFGWN